MQTSLPHPRRYHHSRAQRWGVLIFILSPLAVVAALCILIYYALKDPMIVKQPPVGAGAGETGMSNQTNASQHHPAPDGGPASPAGAK